MANINATITISNGTQQTLSGIATNGIYQSGLLVDWRGKDFTNDPQTTNLLDRSGNGRAGVVASFTYDGTNDGSDGNGGIIFKTDAVDKYIRITDPINPIPVIEAVFKLPTGGVNWSSIVNAFGGTTEKRGIAFFVHSTNVLGLHYYDGATRHYDLFSDVTFTTSRKYHAVMQYNATTDNLEFYLDGVLRKSISVPNLVLGSVKFSSGNWAYITGNMYDWTGVLYEARAYSAPLTLEQIQNNAYVSGVIKVAQVTISNGPQLSFGYTSSQPQNKTASVAISNGPQQTLTGKKGGFGTVTISNGFQITLSYTFNIPENKTASVTISNGTGQTVAGIKNGRAPPMAISNGTGQTLSGIANHQANAIISNGTGQTLSFVSSMPKHATGTVLISNGITQAMTTKKGVAGLVAISVGIVQPITTRKNARTSATISNGFQITLTYTNTIPIYGILAISNGPQIAMTGKHGTAKAIAITNGPQQTLGTSHDAKRIVEITNGTGQTIAALHSGEASLDVSNGFGFTLATRKATNGTAVISNGFTFILNYFAGIPFVVGQADSIAATISMRDTIEVAQSLHASISVTMNNHETIAIYLPEQRGV